MSHRFHRFAQILDLFGFEKKHADFADDADFLLFYLFTLLKSHRFHRFTQIFIKKQIALKGQKLSIDIAFAFQGDFLSHAEFTTAIQLVVEFILFQ